MRYFEIEKKELLIEDIECTVMHSYDDLVKYAEMEQSYIDEYSSSRIESEKLVAVTPMNKNKKVRFAEPSTSTSNTQKHVEAHSNQDTNKHLLPSIGVKSSTNASRSKPRSNTRNNRISRTSSRNKMNKK
ncbi:hypothetical protein Tco_0111416 [Tanacetum coccineum]